MFSNLREYLRVLEKSGEVRRISAPVDPKLEIAEIHRRVIASEGPVLFFESVKGSAFPVVTNLFGTADRVARAFGEYPERFIKRAVSLVQGPFPPSFKNLWANRELFTGALKLGVKKSSTAPVAEVISEPVLSQIPLLTSWPADGGPFVTLPLVYTESPKSGVPNLGMYRIQRFDDRTTGLHMQIGKGGGFHLAEAEKLNQRLPVTITIGGPPALILAAIAPLPENVPEVLLASLVQGSKLRMLKSTDSRLPIFSEAEFVLSGEVYPHERRLEGPFGDHYGYYSLKHDFPVFHCTKVFRRQDAIYPATVVGKPKQEDFFIGDYLQKLLSPLFPLVMPGVLDLWSYGETGYHSLSAAVVRERYQREALVSAFRILGEGQLSLTKFLLLTDQRVDLQNFKLVLKTILERADLRTDLYVFPNTSMDTLDYGGPELNRGSKGVLMGCGDVKNHLLDIFNEEVPPGVQAAVFCPGCLAVSSRPYSESPQIGAELVKQRCFSRWPLIVLVDDAKACAASSGAFLWQVFTKFEPSRDIYSASQELRSNQILRTPPILIDARRKTWYPDEVECDAETKRLVDRRWNEYGI